MKKILVTATALAAFAAVGTAGAADLPPAPAYKAPMAAPVVVPSWTGCYVDGGIGYGMWNMDHYGEQPIPTAVTYTTTDGGRGWLGRGGIGCDWHVPNSSFVIGVFGDYDWMRLNGSSEPELLVPTTGATAGIPATSPLSETGAWYAGIRLGYLPYPNLMTYVDGGWTQTHFGQSNYVANTTGLGVGTIITPLSTAAQTYSGWFIGGGTEYRVPWAGFNGLYWRTEYRFAQYQSETLPFYVTATGVPLANGAGINTQPYVQTVTTSLVWKFNWGGPVVAAY